MAAHRHAKLIMKCAEIAQTDDDPGRFFEMEHPDGNWKCLWNGGLIPNFDMTINYRIKPIFIKINGFDVPEPMREAPDIGALYYHVTLDEISGSTWQNNKGERDCLKNGSLQATRKGAISLQKALLSFTAVKSNE